MCRESRRTYARHEGDAKMTRNSPLLKVIEFYGTRLHHRGQWRVFTKLRRLFDMNVDSDFEVKRAGLRWVLNPADYTQSEFFWLGQKDAWQTYHAKRLVKPGAVIFDVGANFGYYSITLAAHLNRDCTVYAFEPFPVTYERLSKNISLNGLAGCVRPVRLAASDSAGCGSMKADPGNKGTAHITKRDGDVVLTTIDQFCADNGIESVHFMKIDVEGFEPCALRGGAETIKRSTPVILIELNPVTLRRAGSSVPEVVDILKGHGYSLYVTNRRRLEPLASLPNGPSYVDTFCLHARHLPIQ